MLYLSGKGVEKNRKLGISYLEEAAEGGNVPAMYSYAMALLRTKGWRETKLDNAIYWLETASSSGNTDAQEELENLRKEMDKNDILNPGQTT